MQKSFTTQPKLAVSATDLNYPMLRSLDDTYRGKPLLKEERTRNKKIAITRTGGERPFATYKRHYWLARTRFMGLAKNATVYGLSTMAANIRKGTKFLVFYGVGVSKPYYAG